MHDEEKPSVLHRFGYEMAGVLVCGSFFAFDCDDINLGDLKASEAQLQPLLHSFSHGLFTRVKRINLVAAAFASQLLLALMPLIQRDNELGDAGALLIAEGLRANSSLQELRLVALLPLVCCGMRGAHACDAGQ